MSIELLNRIRDLEARVAELERQVAAGRPPAAAAGVPPKELRPHGPRPQR